MRRSSTVLMVAALVGMAAMADDLPPTNSGFDTNASPGRRDRTPGQSRDRIEAAEARCARKAAKRLAARGERGVQDGT